MNSQKQSKKEESLTEVDFIVCCNHEKNHTKICTSTIDAIRGKFNNIITMQAIKPRGESEDMCVIGTAKIIASKQEKFRRELKNLQIDAKNTKKILKVKVRLIESEPDEKISVWVNPKEIKV